MAWSWSHTQEAYDNARDNLVGLDRDRLNIIYAEWEALVGDDDLDENKYEAALDKAITIEVDILIDIIWVKVVHFATCDNGGFNAWVCPYGCHTVSFDEV